MRGSTDNRVRATITANEILDLVSENEGMRLTDISDELDLAKSTVHRHVKTLESLDYLENDGQEYTVGFRMIKYASTARENVPVFDSIRDETDRLADETSEAVTVYFERHGRLFEVYAAGRTNHDGIVDLQSRPLHATAPGRAILAQYDLMDPEVGEVFDEDVLADGEMRGALREIRQTGVAIDRDERREVTRVASAICESGKPLAVLCVSGPTDRLSGRRIHDDIAELLRSATKTVELELLSA